MVNKVRLSAQPPADRSVQPLIRRHGWTAPASCWAARPCSAPLVGAHALERMLRLCPHLRPPGGAQGRHRRRCALPVRLLPLPPPSPHGGLCGSLRSLREVNGSFTGRAVCCGPCRPVRPRNPRMPAYAWRDVRSPRPWQRCVSAASCCGVVLPPSKAAQCNAPVAPASRPGLALLGAAQP